MLLALLACACTSKYGTYLVVKGSGTLEFDRVEFYFGKTIDSPLPTTPRLGASPQKPVTAFVAKRLYADTDDEQLRQPGDRFDYYLPDTPANRDLGDVVVAVAYRGQTPVGIAELRDFTVVGDAVWLYDVPLAPYDATAVELWGRPTADCVRWADPALGETVAVVRDNDVDCDAFVDQGVDCEPLVYCDGSGSGGCIGTIGCLTATPACEAGGCINADGAMPRTCTPALCIAQPACQACLGTMPAGGDLQCALDSSSTHGGDLPIAVKGNQGLCLEPYDVLMTPPDGLPCPDPQIELVKTFPVGTPEHFTFEITSEATGTCKVTIRPDAPGARFVVHHLLISLDRGAPVPIDTFVVGLTPVTGLCGSQPPPLVVDSPTGNCQ